MNNTTILISHDSKDELIAIELKSLLEEVFLNISVYVSGRDLIGGQTWIEEIKSRLRSSHIILSILTRKSLSNNWIYFEGGAGFPENKTIPILTDNLRPEDISLPLNLMQSRMLTNSGIENLIRDIAMKLGFREPKIYPTTNKLTDKAVKVLRSKDVLLLKESMRIKNIAPSANKPWIFEETCLVYDFIWDNHRISIDTIFYMDRTEIQLFGRKNSESYVLDIMCPSENFLPQPIVQYERSAQRLIYQKLNCASDIKKVEEALSDLLSRIEIYKNSVKN